jgi:hypothetical protein
VGGVMFSVVAYYPDGPGIDPIFAINIINKK